VRIRNGEGDASVNETNQLVGTDATAQF